MPVLIPLEGTNLRFHPSLSRMTGTSSLSLLIYLYMLGKCTTMLVILSTYIIVHCTYNENVQSMCPPTTIHGKYPLCLKICVISGICEPYPFCLTMAARPPSLRMAIMNDKLFSSVRTNNRNGRTACENKTLSLQNNSNQRSSIRIIIPVLEYEY